LEHAKTLHNSAARWQADYLQNGYKWRGEGIINCTLAIEVTGPYGDSLKTMPTIPLNVRKLQGSIRAVMQNIDGNILKHVWHELDYCTDICRVMKGAHIQHL
jgi:hypothetical protein